MSTTCDVILVGLGGYGGTYAGYLLGDDKDERVNFKAVIDPFADKAPFLEKVREAEIPIFDTLEDFYANNTADLACIATPIHLHRPQSELCMRNGTNVLCEKPASATVEDVDAMIDTRDETGKFLGIGFQLSFAPHVLALKEDLLDGRYGRILGVKTLVSWPRTHAYYNRSKWAGRIECDGVKVYDSPVNNATAHYLHNSLFLMGDEMNTSANPVKVLAETFRANDIENYDTAFACFETEDEQEVLYYASHAVPSTIGPLQEIECEDAIISSAAGSYFCQFTARRNDGSQVDYSTDHEGLSRCKIDACVEAAVGNGEVICDIETARAHAVAVEGIQKSCEIRDFPEETVQEMPLAGSTLTYVTALQEVMMQCYTYNALPSDLGYIDFK